LGRIFRGVAVPAFLQPRWREFCKTSHTASMAIVEACLYSINDLDTMNYTSYRNSVGNGNVNCNNVTNSHNSLTVNNVIADENREIMQWLSQIDPRGRHQDVRTDRVDGVGSWLLETEEFREWKRNEGGEDRGILFCYGNPGVGKTYLT